MLQGTGDAEDRLALAGSARRASQNGRATLASQLPGALARYSAVMPSPASSGNVPEDHLASRRVYSRSSSISASSRSKLSKWLGQSSATGNLDLWAVPFLGIMLFVRVLTDDRSSPNSRHSGSLNLSAMIAVLFIIVATGLLLSRRRGVLPATLAVLWICIWTAIALNTNGVSTETLREGVREISVIALAVIVYNTRGTVTASVATRIVQIVGFVPALIALYQIATHTGDDIAGALRAYGTFAHPDSAGMFFAIAAATSLWRYLDHGRRRSDLLLVVLFAAALIATASIDGLITMVVMFIALGMLCPGSVQANLVPYALAGIVLLAFFATPLGSQRLSSESSTNVAAAERGEASSSLAWRLHKWKTLIPEWESSPLIGRGLGTTITVEPTTRNNYTGVPPLNEYVRNLVETGIIGLAILLWALAILVRHLIRKRRTPGRPEEDIRNAATLAIVIVIGCLVNSLADNTLLYSPTCYAAALIVAASLSLPSDGRQGTRSSKIYTDGL
jgi:hypothetical protein